MVRADVIVLATPVYFYSMDGQMKTFIDRTVPRYTEINNKDFYFNSGRYPEGKSGTDNGSIPWIYRGLS